MPRPHIAMRKIRDVIRLTLGEGMSLRQVSASVGVPPTTLAEHVRRIRDAGLSWPLPDDLDDDALEAKLFAPPGPRPGARAVPDWAKDQALPSQRRREPPRQCRPVAHRDHPHVLRPPYPGLRRPAHRGGPHKRRDHPRA